MHPSQDGRSNLGELKGHIMKKIGVERCIRYFYYLSRFLSHKLTKREFDKSCFRLLGRENLSLHNQLIRSILRNATVSKSPPPFQQQQQSGPNHSVCSNGGMRKRKMRDSPNGNVEQCREDNNIYGGAASDERDGEFLRPVAKRRIPCKDQVATAAVRDDNQEAVRLNLSASPLVAPLGIQFSVGGGSRRTTVPVSTVMTCYESGGLLPDTELLRKKMESIAVAHGLEGGVSMECANTLNALLDVYLKKLIKSCIGLQIKNPNRPCDGTQDQHCVSVLDFRTAMELNPQQLGEDWPTLLERISMRSFKKQDLEVWKKS